MALDNHVRRGHPCKSLVVIFHLTLTIQKVGFGLLLFFSVIDACIATWLSVKFNQHHNAFTNAILVRTHFLTFTAWWTVLIGGFYLALFLHSASSGSVATSVLSHVVL